MALPPILSNFPFLKLFRGGQTGGESRAQAAVATGGSSLPQDIVDLSGTVQGIPQSAAEAQGVAVDTSTQLAQGHFSLGLDSGFAG